MLLLISYLAPKIHPDFFWHISLLGILFPFLLILLGPIILNLGMIIALGISYFYFAIPELILSWAVIISGILQLLVMIFWSFKINIKIKFSKPRVSKNIKKFFSLLMPNILAGGILQINQFIGVIFAYSIMGAISWLYYADRLVQFPVGIFIVCISTILLPQMFEK